MDDAECEALFDYSRKGKLKKKTTKADKLRQLNLAIDKAKKFMKSSQLSNTTTSTAATTEGDDNEEQNQLNSSDEALIQQAEKTIKGNVSLEWCASSSKLLDEVSKVMLSYLNCY